MNDVFKDFQSGLESPATNLHAVTPSDTEDLSAASRAINVATAGEVRITTVGGTTETVYIAAGIAFPVRARRVWLTGTNATGIVSLS